jgi:hypothetical protein
MDKQQFLAHNNELLQHIKKTVSLKDNSKYIYFNFYYQIYKFTDQPDLKILLFNPDKYAPLITSTDESLKSHYKSLLALMNYSNIKKTHKDIYNKWYTHFAQIKKILYNKYIDQEPTDRQLQSHVKWEDIIAYRNNMKKNYKFVLMCLITMIPPRRQLDWFNIIVYNNPDSNWKPKVTHNYINIGYKTPYILINNYKTVDFYGSWYKIIPENLLNILKLYCKSQEQHLFLNSINKPFKTIANFTTWTNNIIKTTLHNDKSSMNTLRHSYASYMMRTHPYMSLRERRQLARDMGHSMQETLAYDVWRNMNTSIEVK